MRGQDPLETLCSKLIESLSGGTFTRLVLTSPELQSGLPEKILGRLVLLKGEPHLSLTFRHSKRDITKNIPVSEASIWLREHLTRFRNVLLGTTTRDWQFLRDRRDRSRLIPHRPAIKDCPSASHDKTRVTLLDSADARDWLTGLGFLHDEGGPRASKADKLRQIQHYLEIFSHLARECDWIASPPISEAGASKRVLQIVDAGCGKGYLTFGLWHLFHRIWNQNVRVVGVEVRSDLVSASNGLARQVQAQGLEFVCGSIESLSLPRVDALIALHACDTATDHAIRRGIEAGSKLILVAPCCHKEIRPQLGKPEPVASILKHGVMAERLSEWLTDGMRSLYLEASGYRTKIMEFVASEHTPKNLLIAAIKDGNESRSDTATKQIEALKQFFGIQRHTLDGCCNRSRSQS